MSFTCTNLKVSTSDGRNFVLLEPFTYVTAKMERIEVPAGTESDGASTPREIWSAFPPFGDYWRAAFLHDYLYRETDRPKDECDSLFLEAMEALGVEDATRRTLYEGVHLWGAKAFSEYRAARASRASAQPANAS